jgi:predicted dehydrogenase
LALMVAAAGKPCLVEKPMAVNHAECVRMVEAFKRAEQPLWVAFYRRALPRFLKVRELLQNGAIGQVTSVHLQITEPRVTDERVKNWRFDRAIAGAGLLLDLGSHCVDIVDFLAGEISAAAGFSINTARAYEAEDVTSAAFQIGDGIAGTGIWNFNAESVVDRLTFTGSKGELTTPILFDHDVMVTVGGECTVFAIRNPPHVHQPLIQTIVDELHGRGRCESTGETGARSAWVMDRCLGNYCKKI